MSQFARTPENVISFLHYFTEKHRTERSCNLVDGIVNTRVAEYTYLNRKPEFNGLLTKDNFKLLIEEMLALAVNISDWVYVNKLGDFSPMRKFNTCQSEYSKFNRENFWKTVGVAKTKQQGKTDDILSHCEFQIFSSLLELGNDQNKSVEFDDGSLDLGEATPIEVRNHKTKMDAIKAQNTKTAEEQLGARNTKKRMRKEMVVNGDVANEEKREATKQEVKRAKENIAKMPTVSSSPSGGRFGTSPLEESLTAYIGAKLGSDLAAKKEKDVCDAWDMLLNERYFAENITQADMDRVLKPLGCTDAQMLPYLVEEVEAFESVCSLLAFIPVRRFKRLLGVKEEINNKENQATNNNNKEGGGDGVV